MIEGSRGVSELLSGSSRRHHVDRDHGAFVAVVHQVDRQVVEHAPVDEQLAAPR